MSKYRGGIPKIDLPGEEWRPIPGWEDRYHASNMGRIYRVKEEGFPRSGRILRTSLASKGHHYVRLWRDSKPKGISVHLLVMLTFVGPRPEGMETRHLDGDPSNNRVDNLRYGTASENCYDRVRHGMDYNAAKTHCKRGHEFTPENTYVFPTGGRRCRQCKREKDRAVA